jgi:hypothetical protein
VRSDLLRSGNAFGVRLPQPVYCTKIAWWLIRTYTDRHGLKDLVRKVLNTICQQQQSSDWARQISAKPASLMLPTCCIPRFVRTVDTMLVRGLHQLRRFV